jgi:hypothetical protein
MRKSVVDKYLSVIRNDANYFKNYLKWMGTEVFVLKPKIEVLEKYQTAYGASMSTFERNAANYTYTKAYISIDSLDFGKKENIHDLDIVIYIPEIELKTGDLVQFEKLGRLYTYQAEPLENYQNFIFRSILRLTDVDDLKEKQQEGL